MKKYKKFVDQAKFSWYIITCPKDRRKYLFKNITKKLLTCY
ncbi:hypothetical protein HMPREF1366_00345 [Enterococcus faecium ERV26]|nr:hypothetical protein HMPREF9524_01446 [Enterococcus faecium TX0133a01]EFR72146.1 hypothetical protein HMPREF9526_00760 [Enterococcus faecium TX0133B]EFR74469.1 hypothetical protein HMPREF9523_01597 [Enterococcus faecium TX0133A]EFR77003.1 hypothetical protein HMPREF9527_02171 [Enterococcus faecium TX0133C]EFS06980.1 hypothetical protein HMPREF9525_00857 [Enterococcus faecium TX0133a04]EFS08882.1 hypothetical protein HMPREF9522_01811 [Enterococcus faecium TX0082]EJX39286.1 hypothetical prot